MKHVARLAALALAPAFATPALGQANEVIEQFPRYERVEGVTGSIKSIGSDTMNNLMTLWSEGFRHMYSNVMPEIEGKGSSTAPPALISGTAQFGPMSRPMKSKEIDDFEKEYGYKPTALRTAIDMLGVYVHKDNPIQSLTLQQVDAIFSKTRKGGHPDDIRTWGDVGLTGEWANKPISLYGRNSASGTYGYFQDNALFKGDFKASVKEQPGSSAVVQAVANDRYGIGYSGIGYKTADVNAIALAVDASSPMVEAVARNAYTGEYPLARFLYLYVNYKPGSQLEPLRGEFIRYIYSKEGQSDVIKDGYYPVTAAIANKSLASVGLGMKHAMNAGSPR